MNRIEDDLKAALRRKPAPPGFAAKVFDCVGASSVRKATNKHFLSSQFGLAAAAMLILAIGLGIVSYRRHIEVRNEAALQRTLMALSIAAEQLDKAEKKAFEPKRWEQIGQYLQNIPIQTEKNRP